MQQQVQKYQQIQQQIEQVQEFIQQVERNIDQMEETVEAVNDMENQEEGSEILAPIGSGVFAVAELKENSKVVTNIGGEAYQKKDLDTAENVLQKRLEEMKETQEQLNETVQELNQEMQQIQQQLQQKRQ